MSGWIKIEKDLESDPRVLRIAKKLCNAPALHERINSAHSVTLVCGALARLWVYADSHIRDDDSLDMGCDEIDAWLGIPGFCVLMPSDWLNPIGDEAVQLPGFQAHNGVEARKKALTQKRVEQHRKRNSVTPALTTALPDQTKTRPDSDKTKTKEESDGRIGASRPATYLPEDFELTEARRAVGVTHRLDPTSTFENFCNYWRASSGQKARKRDWDAAWRYWCSNQFTKPNGVTRLPTRPPKTVAELEAMEAARAEH